MASNHRLECVNTFNHPGSNSYEQKNADEDDLENPGQHFDFIGVLHVLHVYALKRKQMIVSSPVNCDALITSTLYKFSCSTQCLEKS